MIIIGVDPGEKGACTILPLYNIKELVSLPFQYNTLYDIYDYIVSLDSHYLSGVEDSRRGIEDSRRGVEGGRADISITKNSININTTPLHRNEYMEMWIENPALNPKNGKLSYRKLGERIGEWLGISVALQLSPNKISPNKWQNGLTIPKSNQSNKQRNKEFAIKCFPFLLTPSQPDNTISNRKRSSITHDTADSLLIALYAYTLYVPRNKWPNSFKENICIEPNTIDISIKNLERKPIRSIKPVMARKAEPVINRNRPSFMERQQRLVRGRGSHKSPS